MHHADAPLRVGHYRRVLKDDNSQSVENQRRELRAYCERMGHEIAGEYVDRESRRGAGRPSDALSPGSLKTPHSGGSTW